MLNPSWQHRGSIGQYQIFSIEGNERRYLSIDYNYHTSPNWRLKYDLRGNDCGNLRYSLSVPGQEPFCTVFMEICLPFTWIVSLNNGNLNGNNLPIKIAPGKSIPLETTTLQGEFEFYSRRNGLMYRTTTHRLKFAYNKAEEEYFKGLVYSNYDLEAVNLPTEILNLVERFHPLNGKLLDIGCATGLLVEYALKKGIEAEGIDISQWAIQNANLRTKGRCRVLDFDKATTKDFSCGYDILILRSVLEHLSNPEQALALLFDICSEGGVVYIQTLNSDSMMQRMMKSDWAGYSDYTHKSAEITADWLTETLLKLGFEVLYIKRYFLWNDNTLDEVWQAFSSAVQLYPANIILEDKFGDLVEIIVRRKHY